MKIFIVIFVGGLAALGLLMVVVLYTFTEVPSVDNFDKREVPQSTKIYDQTGDVLLWEIHGEERRTVVTFDKISKNIKNATIAIEDATFYMHPGIRPLSIIRAAFVDVLSGRKQGGSTITQQLVKNALLTPEQTLSRKLKEIIIAVKLESKYSKDEILNLYLNEIPYGSNAYGIEAASRTYFNKFSEDLTVAEAAYLAALPKAPTYYSPYGNHRDKLEERKNLVLEQMKAGGFIASDVYDNAKNERVVFAPQARLGIRAPHFVIYVRELLNEKFGEAVVERGGLRVITTLDIKLQEKAEEIVARLGKENEKKFNASNAAMVAIDPKTGRILTMVGSRDYFNLEREGNFNVVLARRQPGSAFKPIVYSTAFKMGYTPETVLFDLETNFAASGPQYTPQNYDNKFRGPVSFREALAQSLNVPSVKVLYLAGIKNSIQTAEDFGISTLTSPERYGLSLVLGGGEVSLLELSAAYGVFANQGMRANAHAIIEVRDKDNNTLEEEKISTRRVLEENIVNNINSILSDNEARAPIFGPRSPLYFEGGNVAVKTGTTNDYRDAWTVGYSPSIVVGAWAGNNDNSSMTKSVAGFIIAPLWREFMDAALLGLPKDSFVAPDPSSSKKPVLRGSWRGSRAYIIDKASGKLATEFTPPAERLERIVQEIHSILFWVNKDDPDGPIPERPELDPQFYNWELPVRGWADAMGLKNETLTIDHKDVDTSHSPQNWPSVSFGSDQKNTFGVDENLIFKPNISSTYPISEIDIFIDGGFIKSERGSSPTIVLNGDALGLVPGAHTLTLKVYDSVGNRRDNDLPFSIGVP